MITKSKSLIFFILFCIALGLVVLNHKTSAQEISFDTVWSNFKTQYISTDGRVIDFYNQKDITTSEGQSYAMFFALVNNDRQTFDRLLQWTQNNLAKGDLKNNLPAWQWGKKDQAWAVTDENSASDADVWIAWDLIEAGRLWNKPEYTQLGQIILQLVEQQEVATIPTKGKMLLPGKTGFVHDSQWKLNPSYLPPQILARFAQDSESWQKIRKNSIALLTETSPKGFAPDWITYDATKDWVFVSPLVGSYDALRVYLWVGMLNDQDSAKSILLKHYDPLQQYMSKHSTPPESIDVLTGSMKNTGSIGFSAALLPFLQSAQSQQNQLQQIKSRYASENNYYNNVLILFGLGWYENKFRFSRDGQLQPFWKSS